MVNLYDYSILDYTLGCYADFRAVPGCWLKYSFHLLGKADVGAIDSAYGAAVAVALAAGWAFKVVTSPCVTGDNELPIAPHV